MGIQIFEAASPVISNSRIFDAEWRLIFVNFESWLTLNVLFENNKLIFLVNFICLFEEHKDASTEKKVKGKGGWQKDPVKEIHKESVLEIDPNLNGCFCWWFLTYSS